MVTASSRLPAVTEAARGNGMCEWCEGVAGDVGLVGEPGAPGGQVLFNLLRDSWWKQALPTV